MPSAAGAAARPASGVASPVEVAAPADGRVCVVCGVAAAAPDCWGAVAVGWPGAAVDAVARWVFGAAFAVGWAVGEVFAVGVGAPAGCAGVWGVKAGAVGVWAAVDVGWPVAAGVGPWVVGAVVAFGAWVVDAVFGLGVGAPVGCADVRGAAVVAAVALHEAVAAIVVGAWAVGPVLKVGFGAPPDCAGFCGPAASADG
jgi:hypothetical protein